MSTKIFALFVILFSIINLAVAQSTDSIALAPPESTKHRVFLTGSALVTHNGINLVPTFSLNKPAAMFKFSAGKNRFSFDPEFNFSMEGKPWYFIFWLRYKVIKAKRFYVNTAGQLGLNFREVPMVVNGMTTEGMHAERYVAGELSPNYQLAKNLTIGVYYLHSHGLDPGTANSLDFLTFNASLSHINLADLVRLRITPQFYYLHQDDHHGTYFTSSLALDREGFPLSLQSIINQPLNTDIPGGDKLVWNVSLIYSFDALHVKA